MGKLIIDGIEVGGSSSASSVKYNNTNSTLVSTNVQGAITELNESLNEQNKKFTPVILFSGDTTGNVTLSDSVANYSFIEVFYYYGSNVKAIGSSKIYLPNNKKLQMILGDFIEDRVHFNYENILLSNNIITRANNYYFQYESQGTNTTQFHICHVLGYK